MTQKMINGNLIKRDIRELRRGNHRFSKEIIVIKIQYRYSLLSLWSKIEDSLGWRSHTLYRCANAVKGNTDRMGEIPP